MEGFSDGLELCLGTIRCQRTCDNFGKALPFFLSLCELGLRSSSLPFFPKSFNDPQNLFSSRRRIHPSST